MNIIEMRVAKTLEVENDPHDSLLVKYGHLLLWYSSHEEDPCDKFHTSIIVLFFTFLLEETLLLFKNPVFLSLQKKS